MTITMTTKTVNDNSENDSDGKDENDEKAQGSDVRHRWNRDHQGVHEARHTLDAPHPF